MLRRLPWLIAPFVLMALTTSQPAAASGEPEVRAFWADTFANGLKTRAQIDALVAHAVEANANTIVAQVRRRGDSFYTISIEPFTDDTGVEPGLDPLAYLLEQAHARGLEVHAWVIANSIYSGHPFIPTGTWPCAVPCSPDHAFNTHGIFASGDDNWLTRTHPSFTAGTLAVTSGGVVRVPAGWRLSDGNWWTDPGHPDAAEHTVQVIRHLVANYDVDGLHLDRIRYPEMPIARVGTGPIGFATGYNPVSVRRFNAAYGRQVDALPDPWDTSWSDWRRAQMDALVRRIYLEVLAIKPRVKVSTAAITFWRGPGRLGSFAATEAYSRVFQDWHGWTRDGVLDLNMPMIYKPASSAENTSQFSDWTLFAAANQYARQAAIGIGSYLNPFEISIAQIEESRLPTPDGARATGQVLYSYASTNGRVNVRPHPEYFRALSEDGAYVADAPYATQVPVPAMPWKDQPRHGYLLAQVVGADGAAVDGATVTLVKVGAGPSDASIVQTSDGNGYVGVADLAPGAYQLRVMTPAGLEVRTIPEPVTPGVVSRVVVSLGSTPRGPMLRAERPAGASAATPEDVSPLELWRQREPLPEDLQLPPAPPEP